MLVPELLISSVAAVASIVDSQPPFDQVVTNLIIIKFTCVLPPCSVSSCPVWFSSLLNCFGNKVAEGGGFNGQGSSTPAGCKDFYMSYMDIHQLTWVERLFTC